MKAQKGLTEGEPKRVRLSRCRAGLVHSLVVVGRKHANGVFMFRRSAAQKGATESGGPEGRNFRLQRKHSCHDFLQQRAV